MLGVAARGRVIDSSTENADRVADFRQGNVRSHFRSAVMRRSVIVIITRRWRSPFRWSSQRSSIGQHFVGRTVMTHERRRVKMSARGQPARRHRLGRMRKRRTVFRRGEGRRWRRDGRRCGHSPTSAVLTTSLTSAVMTARRRESRMNGAG